ncbi:Peptidoglycan hydrolase FlgJ [compost metagenome]
MSTYSEEFYKKWSGVAQEESRKSGIPTSIILAQGMLESKSGKGSYLSDLSKNANNFFGIKADKSWEGKSYSISSNEWIGGKLVPKISAFRSYSDASESWRDHTKFLIDNPRYAKAGVFSSTDPATVAMALQNAGYAGESKTYATQLMSIIRGSNLTQYDLTDNKAGGANGVKPDGSSAGLGGSTSGGSTSNGGNGIDFGIGTAFGVDFDKLFGNVLFMLIGLLFIAAGIFISFGSGGVAGVVKAVVS